MSYDTIMALVAIVVGVWVVSSRTAQVRAAMAKSRRFRLPMSEWQQEFWVALVGIGFVSLGLAALIISLR